MRKSPTENISNVKVHHNNFTHPIKVEYSAVVAVLREL
jgi:hypothetical protein